MEAKGDLALGLSSMVHSTQSGGTGGQIAGMYCTFQFFNFSFSRISLFRASDWCVNSAPSTVAQHSHIVSRVPGLKEQHWCSQPLRAQNKLILIRATPTSGGVASCRSAFPFSLTPDVHLPPVPHVPLPCGHSSLLPSLCDSFDEVLRHAWFHTSPFCCKSSASCCSCCFCCPFSLCLILFLLFLSLFLAVVPLFFFPATANLPRAFHSFLLGPTSSTLAH